METPATLPMLCHHVFFWLKDPGSETDKQQLIAGIKTLANIEGIKAMHIGEPASTEVREVIDNSYSITECLFFDSIEAEQHYQSHPVHTAFVESCSHLWSKVKVFDSIEI